MKNNCLLFILLFTPLSLRTEVTAPKEPEILPSVLSVSDLGEDIQYLDYLNDYENMSKLNKEMALDTTRMSGTPEVKAPPIVFDPLFIMSAIRDTDIIPLLAESFFLRTNRLRTESILDYDPLGNQFHTTQYRRLHGYDIFFNQMSKAYFSPSSPHLSTYINLTGTSIIDRIQCCLSKINQLFPHPAFTINVGNILGLFKDITLQERRLGLLFYHTHRHRNLITHCKLPLYYLERNFFLTHAQRRAIALEFGSVTAREEAEFRKKYFVSDKIGIGDFRFKLECPVYKNNYGHVHAGTYLTLPTACAFKKGLLGSSFATPSNTPSLTLFETLFNLAAELAQDISPEENKEKAHQLLKDFVLDGFTRTAALLLDTPLGNNGHVGLGFFVNTLTPLSLAIKRPSATDIHWINKLSCEYLFPAPEKRFYIRKNRLQHKNMSEFDNPGNDAAKAARDLAFIQQEMINRFFLVADRTWVQPGVILRWNTKLCHQGQRWGWLIGADTWIQTKDILFRNTIVPSGDNAPLDASKSSSFLSYRGRIIGGINYHIQHPARSTHISLNFDQTIINSGIGKDFVLFLKIESHY